MGVFQLIQTLGMFKYWRKMVLATSHFYGMLFKQYYHFTRKITILNVGHFRDR